MTASKLTEHLLKIDTAARERWESIIRHMVKAQVITENLKAENQMLWVSRMNNILACANEIDRFELILS